MIHRDCALCAPDPHFIVLSFSSKGPLDIFHDHYVKIFFLFYLFISSHRVDGPFSTADFQRGPQT